MKLPTARSPAPIISGSPMAGICAASSGGMPEISPVDAQRATPCPMRAATSGM
jgi:hypothetical protein